MMSMIWKMLKTDGKEDKWTKKINKRKKDYLKLKPKE
jgi:hypothetical protein